jgi:hypothetical protein
MQCGNNGKYLLKNMALKVLIGMKIQFKPKKKMKTIKAKVHMLPTDGNTYALHKKAGGKLTTTISNDFYHEPVPQHLYITTDEEIKKGDWFYITLLLRGCYTLLKKCYLGTVTPLKSIKVGKKS